MKTKLSTSKPRDLANLLSRASACIETPGDLTKAEKKELIEDLQAEEDAIRQLLEDAL